MFPFRAALLATSRGSMRRLAWCLTILAVVVGVTGVACAQPILPPGQMVKNVRFQLDGHVVGYAFAVGGIPIPGLSYVYSYGYARTTDDVLRGGPQDFSLGTKLTVASVSKLVTAIAAVRKLNAGWPIGINSPIGPFLPSDWKVSDYVKNLTFSQLLSQRSGIKDYGNVNDDYQTLKQFFEQPVSTSSTTSCQGSAVHLSLGTAINPNDMTWCYSNFNFGIFRILLPKVAGFPEDPNPVTRPQTLADQYVQIVQQNVFDLLGNYGVACKPPKDPGASYAFAYTYPNSGPGYDWGDVSLRCGAAGWYLSVNDIGPVLASLNANDGKILSSDLWATMQQRGLGLDVNSLGELGKNGSWSTGSGQTISTSVAIFGPRGGPPQTSVIAVLFINSPISGGPSDGKGAQTVLDKAFWGWGHGKAYFFSGSQYLRYDFDTDKVDSGYPQGIAGNWGFPVDWTSGIFPGDYPIGITGVNWGNGKVYFFRGSQYLRYDITADRVDDEYPRSIAVGWPDFPVDWASGIDAAVKWGNGKVYFFRGSQYLRYDIAQDKVDDGYPLDIAGQWPGFPDAFNSGIDAVVNWGNGKVYFFSGAQYLRYDIAQDKVDDGYPLDIAGHWPGFPGAFNSRIDAAVNW